MNYVVWDCETDSAQTDWATMLEVGAILLDNNFKEIERFVRMMNVQYEAKHTIVGPGPKFKKEVKVLNRNIVWEPESISIEADSKHVKQILTDLCMEQCKSAATPGVRDAYEAVEKEKAKLARKAAKAAAEG